MAILQPTDHYLTIDWLGLTPENPDGIRAEPRKELELDLAGAVGDVHAGLKRASDVRVKLQYPVGTPIRNTRQLSLLSTEELRATAQAMGLEKIAPECLGANVILSGIDAFTQLPPSSRLIAENGTALVIDMENEPCQYPAREIEKLHPGAGKKYLPAARGRRGVTGWVERAGSLALGMKLRLHVPPRRLHPLV